MTHVYHHAKFRWTENLTCRFIQLRKENGRLFTGRKYSAQAGWEFILRQMREEFPTIMADVHYRVLKKKWSNLLQQYKELKNPVHGDRNKSDDVSWPFYSAIDEVLGFAHRPEDDDVNPHEFLCLSVTPEEPASPEDEPRAESDTDCDCKETPSVAALQRIQALNDDCSIEIERIPRTPLLQLRSSSGPSHTAELRKRDANDTLVSRLPRATELSIKTVKPVAAPLICVKDFSRVKRPEQESSHLVREELLVTTHNGNASSAEYDGERPHKFRRTQRPEHEAHGCGVERMLAEFFEYTKRRDEENRSIMMRMLHAVENIANKL